MKLKPMSKSMGGLLKLEQKLRSKKQLAKEQYQASKKANDKGMTPKIDSMMKKIKKEAAK